MRSKSNSTSRQRRLHNMILWRKISVPPWQLLKSILRCLEHNPLDPSVRSATRGGVIDVKFRCLWTRLTPMFFLSHEEGLEWGNTHSEKTNTQRSFLRATQKQENVSRGWGEERSHRWLQTNAATVFFPLCLILSHFIWLTKWEAWFQDGTTLHGWREPPQGSASLVWILRPSIVL